MPSVPSVPSRDQLRTGLTRIAVTLVLLAGAALVARVSGHRDQQLPYLVMAGAVVPQLLVLGLALRDAHRLERLRVSRRPMPLLAILGLVLVGSAVVGAALHGFVWPPAWAAGLAACALLLAAAPPVVAPVPRRAAVANPRGSRA